MRYADTNIFIRYLIRDDTVKAEAVRDLVERLAAGTEEVVTSAFVAAEMIYVLTSKHHYGLSREDAATRVFAILDLPGVLMPQKSTV